MKNIDLIRLKNGFDACAGLKGVKFVYAIVKNARLVDVVLGDLKKTIEPDDDYKEFEEARIALCDEHAVRDEHDKPKQHPDGRYIIKDVSAFDVAFEDLKKTAEHKDAVDHHEEKITEYRKLMVEGEADYEPYMIPLSYIPDDITAGQLAAIYEIIEDD